MVSTSPAFVHSRYKYSQDEDPGGGHPAHAPTTADLRIVYAQNAKFAQFSSLALIAIHVKQYSNTNTAKTCQNSNYTSTINSSMVFGEFSTQPPPVDKVHTPP